MGGIQKTKEWSRAIICRPKDNITTEAGIRAQRYVMVPTIEKECSPPSMSKLLGGDYARMWLEDRKEFVEKRKKEQNSKIIKNDFEWWLKLRKTNKCFCAI